MPPIHAAIVHLPIALVVFSVTTDLLGSWTRSDSLRVAGFWTLVAAAASCLAVVPAGYFDMNRASLNEELDGLIHLHLRIGWTVMVVVIVLALWRWRLQVRQGRRLGVSYQIVALLVLALTGFQAWYGGEMVFAYGASVAATGQGVEPAETAKRRLQIVYNAFGAPGGMGHGGSNKTDEPTKRSGGSAPQDAAHGQHKD